MGGRSLGCRGRIEVCVARLGVQHALDSDVSGSVDLFVTLVVPELGGGCRQG